MAPSKEQQRHLIESGVGMRYHNKTLKDVQNGETVAAYLESLSMAELKAARLNVATTSIEGRELFMLVCRILVMKGLSLQVMSLSQLDDWFTAGNYEWLAKINSKSVIALTDFFDGSIEDVDSVFPKRNRLRVQSYILDRIADGKAILTHGSQAPFDGGGWWSPELASHLFRPSYAKSFKL